MGKSNENPLHFWERSDKARSDLERAKDMFRPKTFYEQFKPIERLSVILSGVLPSISVVTGGVALGSALAVFLPRWYIAFAVGFACIIIFELVKSMLLELSFRLGYSGSKAV